MATTKPHQLCDVHQSRRRRRRMLLTAALVAAVLACLCALALYVLYRPVKPQASVARAAVYQLANAAGNNNSTPSPYAVVASLQFTLLLHNPSDRAALLYDGLLAYVAYRGEPVTPPAPLPAPLVQERGADVALSQLLGGGADAPVPVSADASAALAADCAVGQVQLRLAVLGRVRHKTWPGPFRSGWRDLYVRCDVTFGNGRDAQPVGDGGGGGFGNVLEYPQCFVEA